MKKHMDKGKYDSKGKAAAVDYARRNFLRAASGAGALGALAIAAAQATSAPVETALPAVAQASASTGYHETEHIRQYYRSARYW